MNELSRIPIKRPIRMAILMHAQRQPRRDQATNALQTIG